ncbi:MAG: DNA N-6-adenine-methyltransferase, partial [Acidobacteriota bacterium]
CKSIFLTRNEITGGYVEIEGAAEYEFEEDQFDLDLGSDRDQQPLTPTAAPSRAALTGEQVVAAPSSAGTGTTGMTQRISVEERAVDRHSSNTQDTSASTSNDPEIDLTVEWYTPEEYAEAVRDVLGEIDLDPASCEEANRVIRAKQYYTIHDNGLTKDWLGRVFLNPPYGYVETEQRRRSNQELWSAELLTQYRVAKTTSAILLVQASPSNSWFKPLWHHPICFLDHRMKFWGPSEIGMQAKQGHVFVYFGKKIKLFTERFSEFGEVVSALDVHKDRLVARLLESYKKAS